MTDPADGAWRGRGRGRGSGSVRRKPSVAERREERAAETDPEVVLNAAARFLKVRPRSVAEVRRRLRSAGYAAALVEHAVERMVELGFLDDAAFARAWVESRDRARPRGERALRLELRQKGVGREETDEALDERRDDAAARSADGDPDGGGAGSADEAAAERLLARRASQLGRVPDPRVRRQHAYALLARNGFDPGVCSTVAKRFAEAGDDGDSGEAAVDD
jgi:regulatory protein